MATTNVGTLATTTTPPFNTPDYLQEAHGRVTEQFKEADVFKRYLETLVDGYDDILQALQDLHQLRSLDSAEGSQLDIIGEIVGQPRVLIEADLFQYFGFQGALNAAGMGGLETPVGGVFFKLGDNLGGNINLNDEQYRMFIRAKIFKNSFTSTPEEFITAVNNIFQTSTTYISVDGGGHAVAFFGRELTSFERVLIGYIFTGEDYPVRLIPKTVGVRLDFGVFRDKDYFGFQGAPGAKGFGGTGNPFGGYGRDYGRSYGRAVSSQGEECIQTAFLDGEFEMDGAINLDGGLQCFPIQEEECIQTAFLNGEFEMDGTINLDGGMQCFPVDGGWFAELIDVAA